MRRLSVLLLLLAIGGTASAAEVRDDRGKMLELELPVQRVVTLAPHLVEQMFAIGAGNVVVGTSEYSDYPEAALEIPRVGDAYRFDAERIIALEPDVIIAWQSGTPQGVIEKLESLGLPVLVMGSPSIEAVGENLRLLGRLTGNETEAEAVATDLVAGFDSLAEQYLDASRIRVFYQISAQPLFTINARHTISDIIRICGGKNIFADLETTAAAVSREAVIARDPDLIVGGASAVLDEGAGDWSKWSGLRAVSRGNVRAIDAILLARPTPRLLAGARQLCNAIEATRNSL
ncbi:MAG: cobalamin-binding protein [Gammaproteobacteria bacterium]|nr:cobalamin-binding protein [Gammaproteobacteria bacterium]